MIKIKHILKKIIFFLHVKFWLLLNFTKLFKQNEKKIRFISEKKNWSIFQDGLNISNWINENKPGYMEVIFAPKYFKENIIHFGSQYMWVDWYKHLNKKNKYVVSFFHGKYEDGPEVKEHINQFLLSVPNLSAIITSSNIVKNRLLTWGIPKEKLFLIPIGFNPKKFHFISKDKKKYIRKKYKIKKEEIIIGSFQKDGQGWGEGNLPKLIKGPDIFIKVIDILKKNGFLIKIFLTGPARGYMKKELNKLKIPFIHEFVDNSDDLNILYHVLDIYLITSREEGGPKGLIEAMASGVPVVSTDVGMSRDLITNSFNGHISYKKEPEQIANYIINIINNKPLRESIVRNGGKTVKDLGWDKVSALHYKKIYKPLLKIR